MYKNAVGNESVTKIFKLQDKSKKYHWKKRNQHGWISGILLNKCMKQPNKVYPNNDQ